MDRVSESKILGAVATRYDSHRDFDRYLIEFGAEIILNNFQGRRMLEVGCSSGVMTRIFANRVPELHVIDGSEAYVEALRQTLDNQVTFYNCLAEEFEPRSRFDTVVMASILEHLEDPVTVLTRSREWLVPNGSFFAIVPNRDSIHRQVGVELGMLDHLGAFSERDRMLNHRRVYDMALLEDHLGRAGYRIVDRKGIMIKPLSNAQMEDWSPQIVRALLSVGLDKPHIAAQICVRCTV